MIDFFFTISKQILAGKGKKHNRPFALEDIPLELISVLYFMAFVLKH